MLATNPLKRVLLIGLKVYKRRITVFLQNFVNPDNQQG